MRCTPISRSVYLRLATYHFLVASWVNTVYALTSNKIKEITGWPVPLDVKGLRKLLGWAAYLHKYSRNNAEMTMHLSCLLNKIVKWSWNAECQCSIKVSSIAWWNHPYCRLQIRTYISCGLWRRKFFDRLCVDTIWHRWRRARNLLIFSSPAGSWT